MVVPTATTRPATGLMIDRAVSAIGTMALKIFPIALPMSLAPRQRLAKLPRKALGRRVRFRCLVGHGLALHRVAHHHGIEQPKDDRGDFLDRARWIASERDQAGRALRTYRRAFAQVGAAIAADEAGAQDLIDLAGVNMAPVEQLELALMLENEPASWP